MKTIGHDDVVIDGNDEGENDHGDANPHGAGQHLDPDGKGANLYQISSKIRAKNIKSAPDRTDPELPP